MLVLYIFRPIVVLSDGYGPFKGHSVAMGLLIVVTLDLHMGLQHLAQAEIKVWVHPVHKAAAADCKRLAQIDW